ncbi:MAG: hypothetical protein FD165_232 [Gammaproteobacteria bacterium]|nr:MAG: hypothetical protein FD165_232 [Gammaproteobacteria bacterium]TND06810.1 MAG: hypothetical protein FD120_542 [Gammaproteobacteria bacterium]
MLARSFRNVLRAVTLGASLVLTQTPAFADGSETLGPPGIAIQNGTQIVAAGTGMVNQPGIINLTVPAGATIKQVLLYWAGRDATIPPTGDNEVIVNGNSVTGTQIGTVNRVVGFRADITGLGLVSNGNNVLTVENMAFGLTNDGTGVLVIVDDGSGGTIQLRDGVDQAYALNPPPNNTTVPQTFTFVPATINRTANLAMFFGSVAGTASSGGAGIFRPSAIEVTVEGQPTVVYNNLLDSVSGEEWDTVNLPVNVPAGASKLTVQALSVDNLSLYPDPADDWKVASFNWITAGLSLPPDQCGPCNGKVSMLTLQYTGSTPNALVQVYPKRSLTPVFSGTVQPNEMFTFNGNDKFGTLGTDITIKVNGVVNASIHTSCSQPIGPGLVSGDFLVVAGSSRNGGALCPIGQTPPPPPVGTGVCDGKVNALTLKYNGLASAAIKVVQKDSKNLLTVFDGTVAAGAQFSFVGADKMGTLGVEITIYVNGVKNTSIHTSCSQPIGPGLVSGAFTVIAGTSRNGGALPPL